MIIRKLFSAILFLIFTSMGIQAQWDAPVVYYQFNETSGTSVNDSSGNNFNGIANCKNCWKTEGKYNGAFFFQGNHRIDLPGEDIGLTNEKGSVAFWLLLPESSITSINCIWWAGEYGGDMFGPQNEMHINSEFIEDNIWTGGEMVFVINDSIADKRYFIYSDPEKGPEPANPPTQNAITLADGLWHHIACTWEAESNIALYIDGQPIWDDYPYNPNLWDCNIMTLGTANKRTSRTLNGFLDEFRIYNQALNASEIEKIYNYIPDDPSGFTEYIKQKGIAKLSFFPNPAGKQLLVNNTFGFETIDIYNLEGEKIYTQYISNSTNNVELNIEHLSGGLYLIRAYRNNKLLANEKFIKK